MGSWRTPAKRAADVAGLAHRLTDRDRAIIFDIGRLRTLTLRQIARLHFTSLSSARDRVRTLSELGVLQRFRTSTRGEYFFVLALAGLRLYAPMLEQLRVRDHIFDAMEKARPTVVRTTRPAAEAMVADLVANPLLKHLASSNDFYTRLAEACRNLDGWEIERWFSERESWWTTVMVNDRLRPDGAVNLHANGRELRFWIEHDTGTETLGRLIQKLERYKEAAARTVLIELTKAGRERNFHQSAEVPSGFVVATATVERAGDPTAAIWWRLGEPPDRFLGMRELDGLPASQWGLVGRRIRCDGARGRPRVRSRCCSRLPNFPGRHHNRR